MRRIHSNFAFARRAALAVVKERRWRAYWIDEAALLGYFNLADLVERRGVFEVPRLGYLPPDAKIAGVWHDVMRMGWTIVVESVHFEPVPPGAEIPFAPPNERLVVSFDFRPVIERSPGVFTGVAGQRLDAGQAVCLGPGERLVTAETDPNACTCSTETLLSAGCQCGGS